MSRYRFLNLSNSQIKKKLYNSTYTIKLSPVLCVFEHNFRWNDQVLSSSYSLPTNTVHFFFTYKKKREREKNTIMTRLITLDLPDVCGNKSPRVLLVLYEEHRPRRVFAHAYNAKHKLQKLYLYFRSSLSHVIDRHAFFEQFTQYVFG